jgi:hypothetical protein
MKGVPVNPTQSKLNITSMLFTDLEINILIIIKHIYLHK